MDNRLEIKPFLKWVGGKRQLIPEIEKYIPENIETYYEPFIGAGAVLLHIQPKKAVISDMNSELINCYKVIKENLDELITELKKHKNDKDYFYEVRAWDKEKEYSKRSNIEKAARLIFLNKTCFNGLYRVNKKGYFNTPFGKYTNPNIVDNDNLANLNKFFNKCKINIYNQDFEETVKNAKEGDFVYFDPPYDPLSETSSFTSYDSSGFGKKEQERLKKVVDELTKKKVKVLLSNSATDYIKNLYKEYTIIEVQAKRSINSDATKRGTVSEVLIKNY